MGTRVAQQQFESPDIVPQFEQALKIVLAARRQLGAIWRECMGQHYPAMSMIFVADLLDNPGKIELEATAVVPET